MARSDVSRPRVLLVGAGPGASDLLTIRALRAIEAADVILHDALVGEDVLALASRTARLIPTGKRGHRGSVPQAFTNHLMARLALDGHRVVRLKGGDPSIFGRAAEERRFLEERGVIVEVIPGVTTASAAAAQFGFSLTERGLARRVLFVTGRTFEGAVEDWRPAADPETTVCLYMACADLGDIRSKLLAAGRPAHTPVLVAFDVERHGGRIEHGTLGDLPMDVAGARGDAAGLVVIGDAVRPAFSHTTATTPSGSGPERISSAPFPTRSVRRESERNRETRVQKPAQEVA